MCGKSLEFGHNCEHSNLASNLSGKPKFRFHLVFFDAVHGGVSPIRAAIWDAGQTFLDCSPLEFLNCSESEKIAYGLSLPQVTPMAEVLFRVVDHEIHVTSITFVDAIPRVPKPLSLHLGRSCRPSEHVERPGPSTPAVNSLSPSIQDGSPKQKPNVSGKALVELLQRLQDEFNLDEEK